jgi:CRISPR-associated exonuclease Cas4
MALGFFALLLLGILLLWLAQRGQVRSGLPQGRVIYCDTGAWERLERPLFSRTFQLTGKPDYLVQDGADVIPVELKSGQAPPQPYASHILQLAAYCLLVEESYEQHPPYGILKYDDDAFEIDFTSELEQELLATLENMRDDLANGDALCSHDEVHRCRACGYYEHCDQALI